MHHFGRAIDFSVGIVGVKNQNNRHSEDQSTSGTMFIRGFPLYGYLLTVYTPIFLHILVPVVKYTASTKMGMF